jgi:hypothetical protein
MQSRETVFGYLIDERREQHRRSVRDRYGSTERA